MKCLFEFNCRLFFLQNAIFQMSLHEKLVKLNDAAEIQWFVPFTECIFQTIVSFMMSNWHLLQIKYKCLMLHRNAIFSSISHSCSMKPVKVTQRNRLCCESFGIIWDVGQRHFCIHGKLSLLGVQTLIYSLFQKKNLSTIDSAEPKNETLIARRNYRLLKKVIKFNHF